MDSIVQIIQIILNDQSTQIEADLNDIIEIILNYELSNLDEIFIFDFINFIVDYFINSSS
jgi:hypothetical protein